MNIMCKIRTDEKVVLKFIFFGLFLCQKIEKIERIKI
jgi:hypothetical protein